MTIPFRIASAVFAILLAMTVTLATESVAQTMPDIFVPPGTDPELPRVIPNDNLAPAGIMSESELLLDLEIVRADWRVETPDGSGLIVAAVAETGGNPSIPAPLIRVETGTRIRAVIRNTLSEHSVSVFGLQERPSAEQDSVVVEPGTSRTVSFNAGEPGTYLYWMRVEADLQRGEEREQLAGAFIIDPVGGSPPDRVFVMNIFSTKIDTLFHDYGWLEALTINGLSWPNTERQRPAVGDTLMWRIINATGRRHPMHLHGFYFDVISRGTTTADQVYGARDRRKVVTESMSSRSTMAMEWVPTRPGNWLFHCHLSFHVSPEIRLPMHPEHGSDGKENHMAGLVLGIQVQPGPTDLVSVGETRHITLHARDFSADSVHAYGFTLTPDHAPDVPRGAVPGPVLVMRQHQPTLVTVKNEMSVPTGVHWHGLELDSWSDGVPGWSASDGRVSPAIPSGESFTYKLSLMRPGTFVYHSHLNDIDQLTGGLYGALIVLADGETYDPATDHSYLVGWRKAEPQSISDFDLNGRTEQPDVHVTVGESHRLRLINIAPAGYVYLSMHRDGEPMPIRAIAKDGADLPSHQQVDMLESPVYGVGETADFLFSPTESGTYELFVGYAPEFGWRQTWVVAGN